MILLGDTDSETSRVDSIVPEIQLKKNTDLIRILNLLKSPTTRKLLMLRIKQIEIACHDELASIVPNNVENEFKKSLMPYLDNDPRLVDYVTVLVEFPDFREDKVRDYEIFHKENAQAEISGG